MADYLGWRGNAQRLQNPNVPLQELPRWKLLLVRQLGRYLVKNGPCKGRGLLKLLGDVRRDHNVGTQSSNFLCRELPFNGASRSAHRNQS